MQATTIKNFLLFNSLIDINLILGMMNRGGYPAPPMGSGQRQGPPGPGQPMGMAPGPMGGQQRKIDPNQMPNPVSSILLSFLCKHFFRPSLWQRVFLKMYSVVQLHPVETLISISIYLNTITIIRRS